MAESLSGRRFSTLEEAFDHGGELVVSAFVVPKKWEAYTRGSLVFGQVRNSYEYAAGVKWYPIHNHRIYVVAEGLRIFNSPVCVEPDSIRLRL